MHALQRSKEPGVTIYNPPLKVQKRLQRFKKRAITAKEGKGKGKEKEKDEINEQAAGSSAAPPTQSPAHQQQQIQSPMSGFNEGLQFAASMYKTMFDMRPQNYPYPAQSFPQEPTLPPVAKLPSRPSTSEGRTPKSPEKQAQIVPSSPIKISGSHDRGRLRDEYFTWQANRNPSERDIIEDARRKLTTQGFDIYQIRRFEKADWKEWEIGVSLGRTLRDDLKKWAEERRSHSLNVLANIALDHS